MSRLIRLFKTSIGRKLIMAATGLVLVLFLLGHMVGNLLIFEGKEILNSYAAFLHHNVFFIWAVRSIMLIIVSFHLILGITLTYENWRARPQRYQYANSVKVGWAARTMIISGVVVLIFIIYHLLHLTMGIVDSSHAHLLDKQGHADVYSRVVAGFQNPWITMSYLLAIVAVGVHLSHGLKSLFQTLGLNHDSYHLPTRVLSFCIMTFVIGGFIAVPIAVWIGFIGLGG